MFDSRVFHGLVNDWIKLGIFIEINSERFI